MEVKNQDTQLKYNKLIINRLAVSFFFFNNGFLYANWTARLPELQRQFGLNESQLGTVLFCIALGSMLAMPFSGWLAHRFGSHRITAVMAILFCSCIPLVPIFENEWLIRLTFLALGAVSGSLDVTMNEQAILVERLWGKIIFSSFHAVFSIGLALGAVSGAIFARYEIGLLSHLLILSSVGLFFTLLAINQLIKPNAAQVASTREEKPQTGNRWLAFRAILPFGLIAFCCMTGEGAMTDWSAIYTSKVVGQNDVISAWAFGTYGLAMTTGRIVGDYLTVRLGKFRLLILDSICTVCGLGLALAYVSVWTTFAGFLLVGFGVSTIVPIAYSSAGNLKGISPSLGISMVTSIGYSGFFIGPPAIGFLAQAFDLRIGLGFVFILFVIMGGMIAWLANKKKLTD
ncbi:MAG: MFS transporter [Microscillaceae bacterium]|jgi:MFS family permease|nr:MFS transporter [Microscillaceae bacterium]